VVEPGEKPRARRLCLTCAAHRFEPVVAVATSDDPPLTETLRVRIMAGDLRPGAEISADALAGALEADEPTVVGALVQLRREGLVSGGGHEGWLVASMTPATALATIDVFEALCLSATTWAMARLDEHDLVQVRAASARYIHAVEAGATAEAAVAFDGFLTALMRAARNPDLDLTIRPVQARFMRALREYLHPLNVEAYVANHARAMAHIEAGDTTGLIGHFGRRFDDFREVVHHGT
jgi:DNA-binding GntR family transcriptional regulator